MECKDIYKIFAYKYKRFELIAKIINSMYITKLVGIKSLKHSPRYSAK